MGKNGKKDKINKKTKPNQIEALRKKYEALLQEDRKRKERNEYILEKMDKMRTCTIFAHTNHKSNIQDHSSILLPTSNNRLVQASVSDLDSPSYRSFHHRAPDLFAHKSAASMLRDIYSKFILIPKRLPSQRETSVQVDKSSISNTDTNSDWKSKYDILNKLKQEEKEDLGNAGTKFTQPEHQEQCSDYTNETSQYKPEFAEKGVSVTKTTEDNDKNKHTKENFPETKHYGRGPIFGRTNDIENQKLFDNLRSPGEFAASEKANRSNLNIYNKPPKPGEAVPYPFSTIEGSEKIEHLDDEGINPVQISYPSETLGKPFGDVPSNTEDVQYPVDVIDVKDFTPQKDVIVKDGVNVNPEGYGLNQSHFEPLPSHEGFTPSEDVVKDGVTVNSEENDKNQSKPALSAQSEADTSAAPPPHPPKIEKEPSKDSEKPEMTLVSEDSSGETLNALNSQISFNTHQTVPVPEHVEDLGNPDVESENAYETEQQQEVYYHEPLNALNAHISFNTHQTVPVPEHVEDLSNPDVESENTYETEQQEVFNQEPLNEIGYDQGAARDTWDTVQNENVLQNEPYYYEGPHEQVEPVQINEHEETSAPYDQSYEQQYTNNYPRKEYTEALQPFDQSQVEYEHPQDYETQQYEHQEYEQNEAAVYNQEEPIVQYSPETEYVQQQYQQDNYEADIEKQLNQEEGYVAMQGDEQEVLNVESQQQPQM